MLRYGSGVYPGIKKAGDPLKSDCFSSHYIVEWSGWYGIRQTLRIPMDEKETEAMNSSARVCEGIEQIQDFLKQIREEKK